MSRLRLLLLAAGAGTLLLGAPAQAVTAPGPATAPSARAFQLLSAASQAARTRTYSGTQYVATWGDSLAASSIADVRHTPAEGSVVRVRPTAGGAADGSVTPTPDLDPRLLRLLAAHYVLTVGPDASCTGRPAYVVEARRPGSDLVAGRFWIDRSSALVLRREVLDERGRLVHSSAFATVTVGANQQVPAPAGPAANELTSAELDRLAHSGWPIPTALPGGLELFDARMPTMGGQPVLHLTYSDGLSTLSLFTQRGQLGSRTVPGFHREELGRNAVWVRAAAPERVVWGGGGRVFTVLTDAPTSVVRAAVRGLPHTPAPSTGLLARLGRGLARVAGWLNPFR